MNYDDIKKLIDDMGNSKIDELNIEFPDGIKISMKKDKAPVASIQIPEIIQYVTVPEKSTVTDNKNETKKEENIEYIVEGLLRLTDHENA